jgi:hypothetical protein
MFVAQKPLVSPYYLFRTEVLAQCLLDLGSAGPFQHLCCETEILHRHQSASVSSQLHDATSAAGTVRGSNRAATCETLEQRIGEPLLSGGEHKEISVLHPNVQVMPESHKRNRFRHVELLAQLF